MKALMDEFVDTGRYPIAAEGPEHAALVSHFRAAIEVDGCAVLEGFVRPERIADLVAECDRVAGYGHRNFNRTNAYFTPDRPDLPPTHPLRRFADRSNSFVAADHTGPRAA